MFFNLKSLFNRSSSSSVAKSRLHFVLVQDRTGLTNDDMSSFKREMVQVIEKYFFIDEKAFDIEYKRDRDSTMLVINSPIVVRRQEGVHGQAGSKRNKKHQLASKVDPEGAPPSAVSENS